MKQLPFIILIAVIIIPGCNISKLDSDSERLVNFADSLFQVNVDSNMIAGASVIVSQKGNILLNKTYGYGSLELSVPVPDNASFEIGSVTKQFTATAILMLADEEKLSLNDDITDYLDFDTGGRSITIKHLLNHTSGIPSYTEIPEFWGISMNHFERDTLLRIIEKKDFLFEPGEALIYNNSGYFLLGLIIEKVSGMSYEEYLKTKIFDPLGMENTYYCSNSAVIRNKVYGYEYSAEGLKQKSYLDHTWPYAAGSLGSSTKDLLSWMKALHSGEILDNDLYSLLITPGELNDGTEVRYASGIINFSAYGNKCIGHGGGINGFLSDTRYFPEFDLYIICLVNTTGPSGADFFAEQLTWKLISKKDIKTYEIDTDLDLLSGEYRGQVRGRVLTVNIEAFEDKLLFKAQGQEKPDTINLYTGNNTWVEGNNIIEFRDGVMHYDHISGHYILNKN